MGQDEQFSGLFDMAAKKQKKKEEVPLRPEMPKEFPEGQDLQAEFQRCKEMYMDMKTKIENAYERANVSPRQLRDYYADPTNFSSKDWTLIQKEKAEYKSKLEALLPPSGDQEMKPEEKEGRAPKTPKGFVSKKRWLSMH